MRWNKEAVLDRVVGFMSNDKQVGTLIRFDRMPWLDLPAAKPLEAYQFPAECERYLDDCIANEHALWQVRGEFDDDMLPVMKPFFGMAEHSAFVGGEVQFGGGTSYHHPPLEDLEDLKDLACHKDNETYQMLLHGLYYLQEKSKTEGFYTSLRGASMPMELANSIRGNDLFMDFYDDEDLVHELLEFCVEASLWTIRNQFEIVQPVRGGYFGGFGVWLPGNSLGHVSEDASSLCSPSNYLEFGRPYTERVLSHFDSAQVHVHSLGRHSLPHIASLDKIRVVQIEDDPKQPAPIEVYKDNIELLKTKIVMMRATAKEIEDNIDFIAAHKNIICPFVNDQAQADHILALLRSAAPL